MLVHYPYKEFGKADHGWLKSNHHFSFAHYYNPKRMGFGQLRVVNDDWVEPGTGFSAHPHKNMEIISFIRSGEIVHQDSVGNKGVTKSGEVQVMSAGTGVIHSEYNLSDEPLTFYQIWIKPNKLDVAPRWEAKQFPQQENTEYLPLLVSGFAEDEDALFINQNARIYGGRVAVDAQFEHKIANQAYVLASDGEFEVQTPSQTIMLKKGDSAEITGVNTITIRSVKPSEILVIDVPQ